MVQPFFSRWTCYRQKEVDAINPCKKQTNPILHILASILTLFFFGLASGVSAQEQPEFYQRAQTSLQEGKTFQAIQILKKGLQEEPEFRAGWELLGELFLQRRQLVKGIDALSKALALSPSPKVYLLLGQAYHLKGQYPESIEYYQSVLRLSPDSQEGDLARKGLNQIGRTPEEAKQATALYEQSVSLFNQQKFEEALQAVKKLLDLLPDHLAGLSLQSGILTKLGKMEEAIASLERAVSIDPNSQGGLFLLAGYYFSSAKLEKAINTYQRVLQINPQSPQGIEAKKKLRQIGETPEAASQAEDLINEAKALLQLGLLEGSHNLMLDVLKLIPDNSPANFLMGQIQAGLGLFERAIQTYQHVIEVEPGSFSAYFQIGLIFQFKGMFKEAVVHYQAAKLLGGDAPEAVEAGKRLREFGGNPLMAQQFEDLLKNGQEKLAQDDFEGAIPFYEEASRLFPENADAPYQLGLIFKKTGNREEAISSMILALERNPKFFEAHYSLALIYEEEGRITDAIEAYERAVFFGKGIPEAEDAGKRVAELKGKRTEISEANVHLNRAAEFKKANDIEGAIQEYQKAVALTPEVATVHLELGKAYLLRGQLEEAFWSLQKARDIDSSRVQPFFYLGLVYKNRGLYLEASEEFQKVRSSGTDEREVELAKEEFEKIQRKGVDRITSFDLVREGYNLLEKEKFEDAIKVFERAVAFDPLNFNIQVQLGELYERESQVDQAIFAYQKAIELRPWHAYAHQRLAKLYDLQQSYEKAIAEYQIYEGLTDEEKRLPSPDLESAESRIDRLRDKREKTLKRAKSFFDEAMEHIKKGELDAAKEKMKAAIFLDPTNHIYHSNLGFIYYAQDQKIQARLAYHRATSLNKEYAPAYQGVGIITEEDRSFAEALEAYDLALKYGVEGADLEKIRESRERVAKIVERQKEAEVHRVKGYEFSQKNQPDEAIEEYLKAIEIEPNAEVFFNLGLLYQKKEEFDQAEEAYLKALEFQADEKVFLVQLGIIYMNQDRIKDAVKVYEKVIKIGGKPNDQDVQYAKDTLEGINKKISLTFNQTFLTFDSNRNNTEDDEVVGLSAGFGLDMSYPLIRSRRMTLPIRFSTQNTFQLTSQTFVDIDNEVKVSPLFFNNIETLAANFQYNLTDDYSIRTGYNFRLSLTRNGLNAHTHTLTFGGTRRGKWPSNVSVQFNYLRNVSFLSPLLDSENKSTNWSVSQNFKQIEGTLGFGYTYSILNAVLIQQENSSHAGSLFYSRPIIPRLNGNINYSFSFQEFQNPDAFGRFRETINNSIGLGLSYLVGNAFTLNANYVFNKANTTGSEITVDPNLVDTEQVIPLTSFSKHVISITGSLTF